MAQSNPGGMRYRVEMEGADVIIEATRKLPVEIRRLANRDFRDASENISTKMAEAIRSQKYTRGAPQARKVAATASRKRDRLPMVRIPGKRIGLSGQGGRSASGRRVKYRNRATSGRREDVRIAWAATGGRPNPHFPGSTYWIKYVYDDAEALGAREWLEAAQDTLKQYGLY